MDGTAALPILEQAYNAALAAGQHFMAADAAHSCALAGDMILWTDRGLDLADGFEAAAYWRGTLLCAVPDPQKGEVWVPAVGTVPSTPAAMCPIAPGSPTLAKSLDVTPRGPPNYAARHQA